MFMSLFAVRYSDNIHTKIDSDLHIMSRVLLKTITQKVFRVDMKKLFIILIALFPVLSSIAQYQDEFYNLTGAIGVSKTFINHSMNPPGGKVIDSEGHSKNYEPSSSIWGITLFTEWNQTGMWAYDISIKSNFIDDFIGILQAIKNRDDQTKLISPWFYCFLEINNGLNVYYDRKTRIAAGLSANIYQLEFWQSDESFNAQRGLFTNLGPYLNGDYLLTNDLLLKMQLSLTFPILAGMEVKTAKKPFFINIYPGIMMSNGLFFGIDYTIIMGLEDSASGKAGTSLSGSRLELKLAWFNDFL